MHRFRLNGNFSLTINETNPIYMARSATQSQDRLPATLDVREAADILGIAVGSCYRAIREGTFPAQTIRVGGRILVLRRSLARALNGKAPTMRSAAAPAFVEVGPAGDAA